MPKHSGSGSGGSGGGGGSSSKPCRLALITALCLASTLVYVFVLLVPAWRTVHVDRALIGAFLANHSGDIPQRDAARLWDALARDPLLRSRSANAFRECLTDSDDGTDGRNATAAGVNSSAESKSPKKMESHLLEVLAGVVNATTAATKTTSAATRATTEATRTTTAATKTTTEVTKDTTEATKTTTEATKTTTEATKTTTAATNATADHKHRSSAASDRCWFLDLHWSADDGQWSRLTASHRSLLFCIRALFILAVCLLLCYCVCLTGSLYAFFASRMAAPTRWLLLVVHCLSLSLLVALAVLQDVSARLAAARLLDLLAGAGFPAGCEAAVHASRGVWSLALLCLLCVAAAVQMLLLLLPVAQQRRQSRRTNPADAADDKEDGGEKMRECDDAEDTNPLI